MAYDRYDREDRRWRDDDRHPREWERGDRGDRGFFERMGDEVRSWFGEEDRSRDERFGHEHDRWQPSYGERDYNPRDERALGRDSSHRGSGYRRDRGAFRGDEWNRDPYRHTSLAGLRERSNRDDPHYAEWRRRQMDDLDRDYDDYRRERQSKFEEDFGGWRVRRQSKRQLLRDIREHMEVVGSDGEHVGTVDRAAGDRLILTRSDPQSGGVHHSLSCTDIDRVEGDRLILDCTAEKARERWRDESRSRALFEPEDQGRAGPGILDRSFSGTYR